MPRYSVTICQDRTETTQIEVDAADPGEAQDKALQIARSTGVPSPPVRRAATMAARQKHEKLVHAPDGRPRIKPLSSSPKNPDDEVEHARRWVRRILRELGFQ